MKHLRLFNESFTNHIDSDYKFEKKFGISMDELDDYLLEFSDQYPVSVYHDGNRKANYTSFKISIEIPFDEPDLEISGLLNRLKKHSLMIFRNGYNRDLYNQWPSFMIGMIKTKILVLEVKPEVIADKPKRKTIFESFRNHIEIDEFEKNFNISIDELDDYLLEFSDKYQVDIDIPNPDYARGYHYILPGKSFQISIMVPLDEPDLKISGLLNRLKKHSLKITMNKYNQSFFGRVKVLVLRVESKKIKNINESLEINGEIGFMQKFGLSPKDMEDIEDYLTELTDEYDVLISDSDRFAYYDEKTGNRTRITNSFIVVIKRNNYADDLKKFFDPHTIMRRMESFIIRLKRFDIEFVNMKHNEYRTGYETMEYLFKKY